MGLGVSAYSNLFINHASYTPSPKEEKQDGIAVIACLQGWLKDRSTITLNLVFTHQNASSSELRNCT